MANKIILKKSSVASKVPLATDLDVGEIAVNLADQKLYSKNASGTVIAVGVGTATGTVTGVTATSPVASSGGTAPVISLASGYGDTQNPYGSKTANYFLAAPNGTAGSPSFRAIVAADIPTLNQNTTGTAAGLSSTLAITSGGTGATSAAAALTALGAQAAATAITTSNIGSQSVNYATSAGNADTLDSRHAYEMSWGHDYAHGSWTDFNTFINTAYFGAHFVQGTTNGPGHSGAGQYYHQRMSLGSNYNNYSMQFAIPRNVSDAYLYYRNEEGGSAGSWYKIRAGYADSAGSATTAGSITSQANSATITASTGVNASQIVQRDANGYIYASYINHNTSETENPTINSIFVSNGDGWTRKASQSHFISQLGLAQLSAGGVVLENGQTISSNYTMTSGKNGSSAGPITIATGVIVTIPTGSNWVIV